MAKKVFVQDLCDIDLETRGDEVEGFDEVRMIDGVSMTLTICPAHDNELSNAEMRQMYREFGVPVPEQVKPQGGLTEVPSKSTGRKMPDNPKEADCPVKGCPRTGLEGNKGDTWSRGIYRHVSQTKDDAHKAALESHKKYGNWGQDDGTTDTSSAAAS